MTGQGEIVQFHMIRRTRAKGDVGAEGKNPGYSIMPASIQL